MDIRASLAALSASSGPSGREQQTLEQAMELLRPLVDEVSRDCFATSSVSAAAARKTPSVWCWTPI